MKEIRLTEKQIAKFAEYIKENIEDAEIDCDGYFNLDTIGDEGCVCDGIEITFAGNGQYAVEKYECDGECGGVPCTEVCYELQYLKQFNLDEIALFKNGEEDAYSPTQSDFNVICRMVEC